MAANKGPQRCFSPLERPLGRTYVSEGSPVLLALTLCSEAAYLHSRTPLDLVTVKSVEVPRGRLRKIV